MSTLNLAIIPGDGTGPEVTMEAVKVLHACGRKFNFGVRTTEYDLGGRRYFRTGETLSDQTLEELRGHDAILLGAIGHPDIPPGILEREVLLKIRFAFDQYINLRPVRLYPGVTCPIQDKGPEHIHYTVVRENTGGLYTGSGGFSMKGTAHEVAIQNMVYSRHQVERCLRFAFDYAKKHGKEATGRGEHNTVALVGKTNVLTYVYNLWERTFHELGENEYPEIKREYYHVDAVCIYMIQNPEWFDVLVTGNMFGDIITDLAATTQGGMGLAAGGNMNPDPGGVSMFEPIGGTAPKFTGMNVINPIACISSAGMLLEHLGQVEAARAIEKAVMFVTANKLKGAGAGEMGYSTTEVGDMIVQHVTDR